MDSKTTSIKHRSHLRQAFILADVVVGVGLAALLALVVCGFAVFCSRSFAALYNYVDLDDVNRVAIDKITGDVRQANRVSYWHTNGTMLTLEDSNGESISYVYDSSARTLTRNKGTDTTIILKECDRLNFWIGQRNTELGGYDVFPAATVDTAKVLNVSWLCSRSLFGNKINTESVQTARIVIRKQGT